MVIRFLLSNIFFAFTSFVLFAQFKHLDVFPGENGATLINHLFTDYKPATVLNYTDARYKMYKEIYNIKDSVSCVYSHHTLYLDPTYSNPIDYLSKSGSANGINCEHTFPQSKGAETGNAKSDMHHLFPSRAAVNEARLNYPYADIVDTKTKSWYYRSSEISSIPKQLIDEYSESISGYFEPREDHKGNVARAIFYFFTMYEIQADRAFFEEMRPTLCQWHLKDPVDSLEWYRTYKIATYQDQKPNPFVLDCSLPKRCYCSDISECLTQVNEIKENKIIDFYYDQNNDQLVFKNNSQSEMKINVVIINCLGQINFTKMIPVNETHLNLSTYQLAEGTYYVLIDIPHSIRQYFKFVKY